MLKEHSHITSHKTLAIFLHGWVACLCILVLPACKKNFLPDQTADDKIVILSEATAGDLIRIPIGKTIRAGGGNLVKFEKMNDATVVLQQENGTKWLLKVDKSAQYANNPMSVFYVRHPYQKNAHYTLEVMHPILGNARAITKVPPAVQVESIDTVTTIRQGKEVLTVSVTLKDSASYPEAYIIEAVKQQVVLRRYFYYRNVRHDYDTQAGSNLYETIKNEPGVKLLRDSMPKQSFTRLNLFCSDDRIDNLRFDNPENPLRRIFLPDQTFDGGTYKLKFSIEKELFIGSSPDKKGRILLQIKSASRELYKYLLTYEKYKSDFGSIPANQLSSPSGNIQNGLGVFGGATQQEVVWYCEDLL